MDLKKINVFLFTVSTGIALVFAVAFVVGFWMDNPQDAMARETGKRSFETKTTGSLGDGDVEVELTPSIDGGKLIVKVGMNTHTVNLSQFDLKEMTTLEYGTVKIKPTEAKKPRGHHAYGNVVFIVEEIPGSFTIRIKGIPKIPQRVYEWK